MNLDKEYSIINHIFTSLEVQNLLLGLLFLLMVKMLKSLLFMLEVANLMDNCFVWLFCCCCCLFTCFFCCCCCSYIIVIQVGF